MYQDYERENSVTRQIQVIPFWILDFGFWITKGLLAERFQQRKVIECWERNLFHSQTLGACCSVSTPTGILALQCGSATCKTL